MATIRTQAVLDRLKLPNEARYEDPILSFGGYFLHFTGVGGTGSITQFFFGEDQSVDPGDLASQIALEFRQALLVGGAEVGTVRTDAGGIAIGIEYTAAQIDAIRAELNAGGGLEYPGFPHIGDIAPVIHVEVENLVIGTEYTIEFLGTTNWNTVAGTTGVTYATGDIITVATIPATPGTGIAIVTSSFAPAQITGGNGVTATFTEIPSTGQTIIALTEDVKLPEGSVFTTNNIITGADNAGVFDVSNCLINWRAFVPGNNAWRTGRLVAQNTIFNLSDDSPGVRSVWPSFNNQAVINGRPTMDLSGARFINTRNDIVVMANAFQILNNTGNNFTGIQFDNGTVNTPFGSSAYINASLSGDNSAANGTENVHMRFDVFGPSASDDIEITSLFDGLFGSDITAWNREQRFDGTFRTGISGSITALDCSVQGSNTPGSESGCLGAGGTWNGTFCTMPQIGVSFFTSVIPGDSTDDDNDIDLSRINEPNTFYLVDNQYPNAYITDGFPSAVPFNRKYETFAAGTQTIVYTGRSFQPRFFQSNTTTDIQDVVYDIGENNAHLLQTTHDETTLPTRQLHTIDNTNYVNYYDGLDRQNGIMIEHATSTVNRGGSINLVDYNTVLTPVPATVDYASDTNFTTFPFWSYTHNSFGDADINGIRSVRRIAPVISAFSQQMVLDPDVFQTATMPAEVALNDRTLAQAITLANDGISDIDDAYAVLKAFAYGGVNTGVPGVVNTPVLDIPIVATGNIFSVGRNKINLDGNIGDTSIGVWLESDLYLEADLKSTTAALYEGGDLFNEIVAREIQMGTVSLSNLTFDASIIDGRIINNTDLIIPTSIVTDFHVHGTSTNADFGTSPEKDFTFSFAGIVDTAGTSSFFGIDVTVIVDETAEEIAQKFVDAFNALPGVDATDPAEAALRDGVDVSIPRITGEANLTIPADRSIASNGTTVTLIQSGATQGLNGNVTFDGLLNSVNIDNTISNSTINVIGNFIKSSTIGDITNSTVDVTGTFGSPFVPADVGFPFNPAIDAIPVTGDIISSTVVVRDGDVLLSNATNIITNSSLTAETGNIEGGAGVTNSTVTATSGLIGFDNADLVLDNALDDTIVSSVNGNIVGISSSTGFFNAATGLSNNVIINGIDINSVAAPNKGEIVSTNIVATGDVGDQSTGGFIDINIGALGDITHSNITTPTGEITLAGNVSRTSAFGAAETSISGRILNLPVTDAVINATAGRISLNISEALNNARSLTAVDVVDSSAAGETLNVTFRPTAAGKTFSNSNIGSNTDRVNTVNFGTGPGSTQTNITNDSSVFAIGAITGVGDVINSELNTEDTTTGIAFAVGIASQVSNATLTAPTMDLDGTTVENNSVVIASDGNITNATNATASSITANNGSITGLQTVIDGVVNNLDTISRIEATGTGTGEGSISFDNGSSVTNSHITAAQNIVNIGDINSNIALGAIVTASGDITFESGSVVSGNFTEIIANDGSIDLTGVSVTSDATIDANGTTTITNAHIFTEAIVDAESTVTFGTATGRKIEGSTFTATSIDLNDTPITISTNNRASNISTTGDITNAVNITGATINTANLIGDGIIDSSNITTSVDIGNTTNVISSIVNNSIINATGDLYVGNITNSQIADVKDILSTGTFTNVVISDSVNIGTATDSVTSITDTSNVNLTGNIFVTTIDNSSSITADGNVIATTLDNSSSITADGNVNVTTVDSGSNITSTAIGADSIGIQDLTNSQLTANGDNTSTITITGDLIANSTIPTDAVNIISSGNISFDGATSATGIATARISLQAPSLITNIDTLNFVTITDTGTVLAVGLDDASSEVIDSIINAATLDLNSGTLTRSTVTTTGTVGDAGNILDGNNITDSTITARNLFTSSTAGTGVITNSELTISSDIGTSSTNESYTTINNTTINSAVNIFADTIENNTNITLTGDLTGTDITNSTINGNGLDSDVITTNSISGSIVDITGSLGLTTSPVLSIVNSTQINTDDDIHVTDITNSSLTYDTVNTTGLINVGGDIIRNSILPANTTTLTAPNIAFNNTTKSTLTGILNGEILLNASTDITNIGDLIFTNIADTTTAGDTLDLTFITGGGNIATLSNSNIGSTTKRVNIVNLHDGNVTNNSSIYANGNILNVGNVTASIVDTNANITLMDTNTISDNSTVSAASIDLQDTTVENSNITSTSITGDIVDVETVTGSNLTSSRDVTGIKEITNTNIVATRDVSWETESTAGDNKTITSDVTADNDINFNLADITGGNYTAENDISNLDTIQSYAIISGTPDTVETFDTIITSTAGDITWGANGDIEGFQAQQRPVVVRATAGTINAGTHSNDVIHGDFESPSIIGFNDVKEDSLLTASNSVSVTNLQESVINAVSSGTVTISGDITAGLSGINLNRSSIVENAGIVNIGGDIVDSIVRNSTTLNLTGDITASNVSPEILNVNTVNITGDIAGLLAFRAELSGINTLNMNTSGASIVFGAIETNYLTETTSINGTLLDVTSTEMNADTITGIDAIISSTFEADTFSANSSTATTGIPLYDASNVRLGSATFTFANDVTNSSYDFTRTDTAGTATPGEVDLQTNDTITISGNATTSLLVARDINITGNADRSTVTEYSDANKKVNTFTSDNIIDSNITANTISGVDEVRANSIIKAPTSASFNLISGSTISSGTTEINIAGKDVGGTITSISSSDILNPVPNTTTLNIEAGIIEGTSTNITVNTINTNTSNLINVNDIQRIIAPTIGTTIGTGFNNVNGPATIETTNAFIGSMNGTTLIKTTSETSDGTLTMDGSISGGSQINIDVITGVQNIQTNSTVIAETSLSVVNVINSNVNFNPLTLARSTTGTVDISGSVSDSVIDGMSVSVAGDINGSSDIDSATSVTVSGSIENLTDVSAITTVNVSDEINDSVNVSTFRNITVNDVNDAVTITQLGNSRTYEFTVPATTIATTEAGVPINGIIIDISSGDTATQIATRWQSQYNTNFPDRTQATVSGSIVTVNDAPATVSESDGTYVSAGELLVDVTDINTTDIITVNGTLEGNNEGTTIVGNIIDLNNQTAVNSNISVQNTEGKNSFVNLRETDDDLHGASSASDPVNITGLDGISFTAVDTTPLRGANNLFDTVGITLELPFGSNPGDTISGTAESLIGSIIDLPRTDWEIVTETQVRYIGTHLFAEGDTIRLTSQKRNETITGVDGATSIVSGRYITDVSSTVVEPAFNATITPITPLTRTISGSTVIEPGTTFSIKVGGVDTTAITGIRVTDTTFRLETTTDFIAQDFEVTLNIPKKNVKLYFQDTDWSGFFIENARVISTSTVSTIQENNALTVSAINFNVGLHEASDTITGILTRVSDGQRFRLGIETVNAIANNQLDVSVEIAALPSGYTLTAGDTIAWTDQVVSVWSRGSATPAAVKTLEGYHPNIQLQSSAVFILDGFAEGNFRSPEFQNITLNPSGYSLYSRVNLNGTDYRSTKALGIGASAYNQPGVEYETQLPSNNLSSTIDTSPGDFVNGVTYTITAINDGVGGADTNFELIGASDNNIGTAFVASGTGTGNGTGIATRNSFFGQTLNENNVSNEITKTANGTEDNVIITTSDVWSISTNERTFTNEIRPELRRGSPIIISVNNVTGAAGSPARLFEVLTTANDLTTASISNQSNIVSNLRASKIQRYTYTPGTTTDTNTIALLPGAGGTGGGQSTTIADNATLAIFATTIAANLDGVVSAFVDTTNEIVIEFNSDGAEDVADATLIFSTASEATITEGNVDQVYVTFDGTYNAVNERPDFAEIPFNLEGNATPIVGITPASTVYKNSDPDKDIYLWNRSETGITSEGGWQISAINISTDDTFPGAEPELQGRFAFFEPANNPLPQTAQPNAAGLWYITEPGVTRSQLFNNRNDDSVLETLRFEAAGRVEPAVSSGAISGDVVNQEQITRVDERFLRINESEATTTRTVSVLTTNQEIFNISQEQPIETLPDVPFTNVTASVFNGITTRTFDGTVTRNSARQFALVASSLVSAGDFIIGSEYTITTVGTTVFTDIGAADNNIGTVFTATGVGTGTGTATLTANQVQLELPNAGDTVTITIDIPAENRGPNYAISDTIQFNVIKAETEEFVFDPDTRTFRYRGADVTLQSNDITFTELSWELSPNIVFSIYDWDPDSTPPRDTVTNGNVIYDLVSRQPRLLRSNITGGALTVSGFQTSLNEVLIVATGPGIQDYYQPYNVSDVDGQLSLRQAAGELDPAIEISLIPQPYQNGVNLDTQGGTTLAIRITPGRYDDATQIFIANVYDTDDQELTIGVSGTSAGVPSVSQMNRLIIESVKATPSYNSAVADLGRPVIFDDGKPQDLIFSEGPQNPVSIHPAYISLISNERSSQSVGYVGQSQLSAAPFIAGSNVQYKAGSIVMFNNILYKTLIPNFEAGSKLLARSRATPTTATDPVTGLSVAQRIENIWDPVSQTKTRSEDLFLESLLSGLTNDIADNPSDAAITAEALTHLTTIRYPVLILPLSEFDLPATSQEFVNVLNNYTRPPGAATGVAGFDDISSGIELSEQILSEINIADDLDIDSNGTADNTTTIELGGSSPTINPLTGMPYPDSTLVYNLPSKEGDIIVGRYSFRDTATGEAVAPVIIPARDLERIPGTLPSRLPGEVISVPELETNSRVRYIGAEITASSNISANDATWTFTRIRPIAAIVNNNQLNITKLITQITEDTIETEQIITDSSVADNNTILDTAGSFVIGTEYVIVTAPTISPTNFVAIGAADNNIGTIFTATGAGTGTGTARRTRVIEVKQFAPLDSTIDSRLLNTGTNQLLPRNYYIIDHADNTITFKKTVTLEASDITVNMVTPTFTSPARVGALDPGTGDSYFDLTNLVDSDNGLDPALVIGKTIAVIKRTGLVDIPVEISDANTVYVTAAELTNAANRGEALTDGDNINVEAVVTIDIPTNLTMSQFSSANLSEIIRSIDVEALEALSRTIGTNVTGLRAGLTADLSELERRIKGTIFPLY